MPASGSAITITPESTASPRRREAVAMFLASMPRRLRSDALVIGWSGVLLGVALGVVLARNVGSIAPWLERTLRFQIMDADVYYITRIPSELQLSNVLWIGGAALLLTALATVYPALRASRVAPADALRYE